MPGIAANNVDIFVDRYDLATQLKDMNFDRSAEILDSTTFGASARTKQSDLKDGKLGGSGYWSGATGDIDEQLAAVFNGGDKYFSVIMEGALLGKRASYFTGINNKYSIGGKLGSLVAVDFETEVDGLVSNGLITLPLATYTNSGPNAPAGNIDFGAAGSPNWAMLVHVLAVSGTTPSMLLVPRHSTSLGGTYTTMTGSGLTVTAPGVYLLTGTQAGGVNQAIQINRTISGTSPSFTMIGIFVLNAF